MFSRLLDQEIAYFDANRTGDLINRLSSDAVVVQKALTNNVASGLKAVFMVSRTVVSSGAWLPLSGIPLCRLWEARACCCSCLPA
jgi:ABC-type multidrug transport system fused ATPase/permease subunit